MFRAEQHSESGMEGENGRAANLRVSQLSSLSLFIKPHQETAGTFKLEHEGLLFFFFFLITYIFLYHEISYSNT